MKPYSWGQRKRESYDEIKHADVQWEPLLGAEALHYLRMIWKRRAGEKIARGIWAGAWVRLCSWILYWKCIYVLDMGKRGWELKTSKRREESFFMFNCLADALIQSDFLMTATITIYNKFIWVYFLSCKLISSGSKQHCNQTNNGSNTLVRSIRSSRSRPTRVKVRSDGKHLILVVFNSSVSVRRTCSALALLLFFHACRVCQVKNSWALICYISGCFWKEVCIVHVWILRVVAALDWKSQCKVFLFQIKQSRPELYLYCKFCL